MFVAAQQEEAALAEQEKRLAEMLAGSRNAAGEAGERLKQVQGLAEEVGRGRADQGRAAAGAGARPGASARRRDAARSVGGAAQATRGHVQGARPAPHAARAFSEKRIAAFEARAAELAHMTEEIDAKIAEIGRRDAIVEAVRKEVAGVHEISARSKSDLQYVEAHRNDVAALRERVDEALACVGETETRLAQIESRKRLVDEVQLKTNVITNMLEDVRLNLETLGEQKASSIT